MSADLAAFFATIGPFLEGRAGHDETVRALYPREGGADTPDARRLAIYARFCRAHRRSALGGVYTHVRDVVVAARGEDGWHALVEAYFRAHPMHHAELSENGDAFPAWIAGLEAPDLPPYTSELTDLAWWAWRTRIAPDDPADTPPDAGPTRLASTVEVRPYTWDLVAWFDGGRSGAPMRRDGHVLFWREPDLTPRREAATLLELHVLQRVSGDDATAPKGIDSAAFAEALADLRDAGIVLGAR